MSIEKYRGDITALSNGEERRVFELQAGRLRLEVEPNAEGVAEKTARDLFNVINNANKDSGKKIIIIALPTGNTPSLMYEKFSQIVQETGLNLSKVVVARIEGFIGIDRKNDKSFDGYIEKNFFNANNLAATPDNFISMEDFIDNPDSLSTEEINEKAKLYDKKIASLGGIDYAILGLGGDAHVGDIQPSNMSNFRAAIKTRHTRALRIPDDFDHYTRTVMDSQYKDKTGYPSPHLITLGLKAISRAKKLTIMATGQTKSEAIRRGVSDALKRWNHDRVDQETTSPLGFLLTVASRHPDRSVKIVADENAYNDLFKEAV